MSKVSKMKMSDLIKETGIMMYNKDIDLYCSDDKFMEEFDKLYMEEKINNDTVEELLIKYEDKIDKEKFLVILIENYRELIKSLEKKLLKANEEKNQEEQIKLMMKIANKKESLKKAINLAEGIDVVIPKYRIDNTSHRCYLEIIDSKEIIKGKSNSKRQSKKLQEYNKLKSYISNGNKEKEKQKLEEMMCVIEIEDINSIFSDERFGRAICNLILYNYTIDEGLDINNDKDKILEYAKKDEYKKFYHETIKTMDEYCKYMDLRKFAILSAYRIEMELEKTTNHSIDDIKEFKEILEGLEKYVEENKMFIILMVQNEDGISELKYSAQNIKNCLSKFVGDTYLQNKDIEEYREKTKNNLIKLNDIPQEYIDIIYNQQELENIAKLSKENFEYVSEKLNWSKEKVIETLKYAKFKTNKILESFVTNNKIETKDIINLYMDGTIGIEQIRDLSNNIDFSKDIDSHQLNEYYNESILEKDDEKSKENYGRYLELYKTVLIGKNPKEIEEYSEELMEQIVEEYQNDGKEEYIQKIENYYQNGIITLNSILDWNDTQILTRLYDDKLVSLEDLKELAKEKKVTCNYFMETYNKMIWDKNIDYDERIKYINEGYISEDEIFKLYENNYIFEEDMKKLAKIGLVSESKLQDIINSTTKEQLEKKSNIKLGNLNRLSKRNNEIYTDGSKSEEHTRRDKKGPKIIIDPNEREEFISLFKACKAEAMLDKDNSFYNYEFYVIPDESGNVGLNSVVIAERYYEDKETETRFATNNATYFFKYKDLLVLSKMKKSDLIKERKNIVFTANHSIATDKKDGRWASNVIYKFAYTMLSSDLSEYSDENKRKIIIEVLNDVYSHDEIMQILDKAIEIDEGKYNCQIEDVNER